MSSEIKPKASRGKKATKKKVANKKAAKKKAAKKKRSIQAQETKKKPGESKPTKLHSVAQPDRKLRIRSVIRKLHKLFPDANCALTHKNAFELLIATILSAQSTDATVNKLTPQLFENYPTAEKLAAASQSHVEELVRTSGFFRQKAKNIIGAAKILCEKHQGEVPKDIDSLIECPGVARKTANVVLGTFYGINVGVVVDTHVGRICTRLDLTPNSKDSKDAVRIERDLMAILPKKEWTYWSHALILHGRATCDARRPKCEECELAKYCPTRFLC